MTASRLASKPTAAKLSAHNIVLFVGTLEPRKNLDGLARAVAGSDRARLVVVGPTGWGDVTAPANAVVLGPRSDREVAELMGKRRGAIRGLQFRALSALRDLLHREQDELVWR